MKPPGSTGSVGGLMGEGIGTGARRVPGLGHVPARLLADS
jgi:hypothetical protein